MVKSAKISSKGQITLPREVREVLGTDIVRIVCDAGKVSIEPVADLAGSLAHHARKPVPYALARERAWDAVVRQKHKRR